MKTNSIILKRVLTGLLAISMIVTALPSYALADSLPGETASYEETTLLNEAGQDELSEESTEILETETASETTVEESEEQSATEVASEEESGEGLSEEETLPDETLAEENNEVSEVITEVPADEQEMLGNDEQLNVMIVLNNCSLDSSSLNNITSINSSNFVLDKVNGKYPSSFSFTVLPDKGYIHSGAMAMSGGNGIVYYPVSRVDNTFTIMPEENSPGFDRDIILAVEYVDPSKCRKIIFDYNPNEVFVSSLQTSETNYYYKEYSSKDMGESLLAKEGYQIDSVKIDDVECEYTAGLYIVPAGEGEVTLTIKSSPKRIPVTYKVDGATYNSEVSHASVSLEGLTEDNKTDGKTIDINVSPEEGYEVIGVTYSAGSSLNGEATLSSENKYTIAADVVAKLAAVSNEGIVINITTKKSDTNIVTVEYSTSQIESVRAITDGKYIENLSETEGMAKFKVEKGTKLTLRPVIKEHYEITGILPESLEAEHAKNGDYILTVNEETSVEIISNGIPTLYYKRSGSSDPYKKLVSGSTLSIGCYDDSYAMQMNEGDSEDKRLIIESAVAKVGNKAADDGFIEIIDSERGVKIDPSVLAGKTAKVTITGKNESDITFNKTFNVTVSSQVSSISLSGFKKGSKETEQYAGSSVDYTITANKGADLSSITPVLADSGSNADLIYEPANKKLTVRMYKRDMSNKIKIATEPVVVNFKDKKSDDVYDTYTFTPVKKQYAAPTVKVTEAKDISMLLTMDVPKELKSCENLFFKIDAAASTKEVAEGMLNEIKTLYIPYYSGSEHTRTSINLAASETEPGNGAAQKYDISVSLIQLSVEDQGYEDTNIYTTSSVKKLLKQSTKDPCYETKLALNKKNSSVIIGQTGVVLATVKYSSKTTFTGISKAIMTDSKGNTVATSGVDRELFIIDDAVVLSDWSDSMRTPGKYTLHVYPNKDSNTHCTPASMTVTFKPAVTAIYLNTASTKIYKQDKKAASIKIKAVVESKYNGVSYKPANSRLVWSVQSTANPTLEKAASIKNGTLIIDKDYVLSSDSKDNMIYVFASTTNGNRIMTGISFEVTNASMQPASVFIGDTEGVDSDPESLISTALDGKTMVIKDEKGENLSLDNMTVTITPKTGMTVSDTGTVKVTKPGTYTVKAVANDGGKKSIVRKFAVKYDDIRGYDLSVKTGLIDSNWNYKNELADTTGTAVDPGDVIYVRITPKSDNEDTLCSSTASVKLKNAKLVKNYKAGEGEYYIRPTSYPCEVTVSSKDGKLAEKKYSFTPKELPVKLTADKKQYSFVIKETKELGQFTFSTENFVIDSSKNYVLYFNPVDKDLADKNKLEKTSAAAMCIMMGMTTKGEYIPDNKDTSKGTFVFKPYYALSDIYPGTYSLQVQLFEYDIEGEGIAISNPIQIKVKFTEAPAPKVALKKTVTVSSSADATVLPYKNCKNLYGVTGVNIYNDLIKGVPNDFAEYFIADMTQDAKNIVLRRTAKAIPAGLKQITGWVEYTALGKDGKKYTKEEKITVKFTSSDKTGVPVYFAVDEMPDGVSVSVSDVTGVAKKTGLSEGKAISFALKDDSKLKEKYSVTYQYDLGDPALELEYNSDTGRYTVPAEAVSGAENYKSFLYIRVSLSKKS